MKQRTILFLLSVLLTANLSASNNFRTATRAFYLWRCGCAVEADYNGDHFVQKPCHLKDGYMDYVDGTHTIRDGVGVGTMPATMASTPSTLPSPWQTSSWHGNISRKR